MEKKNKRYSEVKFDSNGKDFRVKCRSMNIDSLMLYFMELPDVSKKTRSKEDVLSDLVPVITRDVFGHITFPMMHECVTELNIKHEEDGTHTFIFSDGVYEQIGKRSTTRRFGGYVQVSVQ